MTTLGPPLLQLRSDLRLQVDDLHTHVVADGSTVTVDTDDAGALFARATEAATALPEGGPSLRAVIGRAAALLDDAGLTARITSHGSTVAEFGHGCGSGAGRLLFGTDRVSLGSSGALVPTLLGYARASQAVRRRLGYTSAGVVIAALLAEAALRRRHNGARA